MKTEFWKKCAFDSTVSVTPSNGPQSGFMDFQIQQLTYNILSLGPDNVHTHKNTHIHTDETIMESSLAELNQSTHVPYDPAIPLLGLYPREIHTQPKRRHLRGVLFVVKEVGVTEVSIAGV